MADVGQALDHLTVGTADATALIAVLPFANLSADRENDTSVTVSLKKSAMPMGSTIEEMTRKPCRSALARLPIPAISPPCGVMIHPSDVGEAAPENEEAAAAYRMPNAVSRRGLLVS